MTDSAIKQDTTGRVAQPWLSSAAWDTALIISPAFVTSLIALVFASQLDNSKALPVWAWVTFVLLVDVAHVYATLFRTYLDRKAFNQNGTLLLTIPIACWTVGCLLYCIDGLLFWRALAYLAVFHFIRQQFGFMALYSRKDPEAYQKFRWLDSACIYAATLYPLIYWHTHLPRNFNWFVNGDFAESLPAVLSEVALLIYMAVAALYIAKELTLLKTTGFFNIPRNLIVFGTALSWWVGIVALNSDIAFTMTNVVTHGIPYMALIWLYRNSSAGDPEAAKASAHGSGVSLILRFITRRALSCGPAFVFLLWTLAYLEEGIWDGLIWREHLGVFLPFSTLPAISDFSILAIVIPLLSLPQSTHYVLDGFIWRVKDRSSIWST